MGLEAAKACVLLRTSPMIARMMTVFGVEGSTAGLWADSRLRRRPVNGAPRAQVLTKVS